MNPVTYRHLEEEHGGHVTSGPCLALMITQDPGAVSLQGHHMESLGCPNTGGHEALQLLKIHKRIDILISILEMSSGDASIILEMLYQHLQGSRRAPLYDSIRP